MKTTISKILSVLTISLCAWGAPATKAGTIQLDITDSAPEGAPYNPYAGTLYVATIWNLLPPGSSNSIPAFNFDVGGYIPGSVFYESPAGAWWGTEETPFDLNSDSIIDGYNLRFWNYGTSLANLYTGGFATVYFASTSTDLQATQALFGTDGGVGFTVDTRMPYYISQSRVPDTGSTLLLTGLSLLGMCLAGLRRDRA